MPFSTIRSKQVRANYVVSCEECDFWLVGLKGRACTAEARWHTEQTGHPTRVARASAVVYHPATGKGELLHPSPDTTGNP